MLNLIAAVTMVLTVGLIFRDLFRASRELAWAILGWFLILAAVAISPLYREHFSDFPPFPVRFAVLFLAALLASLFSKNLRAAWRAIPTEKLVLWHWARAPIGLAFVISAQAGTLAPQFGSRAGWGDLLAGLWAIAIAAVPVLRRRFPLLAWNVVGTADLGMAVGTAMLTVNSPMQIYPFADQMRMLGEFPFALVPSFFVPLLLFTHVLVFTSPRAKPAYAYSSR
jgi:hypothetical protein